MDHAGHPACKAPAALWVNQTVTQRSALLESAGYCCGEGAPKRLDPIGIGRSITTKINANIGASPISSDMCLEIEKLRWAQRFGADTLMDLSTGGDLDKCRQEIINNSTIPIGTVPIYSMIIGRQIEELTYDDILRTIEHQAQQGVDYFTIHAGVLREHIGLIRNRTCGFVFARRVAAREVDGPSQEAKPDVRSVRRDQRHHAHVRHRLFARRRVADQVAWPTPAIRRRSPSCTCWAS